MALYRRSFSLHAHLSLSQMQLTNMSHKHIMMHTEFTLYDVESCEAIDEHARVFAQVLYIDTDTSSTAA